MGHRFRAGGSVVLLALLLSALLLLHAAAGSFSSYLTSTSRSCHHSPSSVRSPPSANAVNNQSYPLPIIDHRLVTSSVAHWQPAADVCSGAGESEAKDEGVGSLAWVETLRGVLPIWSIRVGDWLHVHESHIEVERDERQGREQCEQLVVKREAEQQQRWSALVQRLPAHTCLFQPVTAHAVAHLPLPSAIRLITDERGAELTMGRHQRLVWNNSLQWQSAEQISTTYKALVSSPSSALPPTTTTVHILTVQLAHNYYLSISRSMSLSLLVHNGGVMSRIGTLFRGERPNNIRPTAIDPADECRKSTAQQRSPTQQSDQPHEQSSDQLVCNQRPVRPALSEQLFPLNPHAGTNGQSGWQERSRSDFLRVCEQL